MKPTALLTALKKKYRTPAEALAALGLDASLLDPDEPSPLIAHDGWTTSNRSPNMSTQEQRLVDALRRRFRGGPLAVLKRLGMDQSELDPPDDDERTDAVGALLRQFGELSDEDKKSFLEAVGEMAQSQDGFSQRGRPQAMDSARPVSSFATRYPHAAKIGNGW